jgi:hypothetical protein
MKRYSSVVAGCLPTIASRVSEACHHCRLEYAPVLSADGLHDNASHGGDHGHARDAGPLADHVNGGHTLRDRRSQHYGVVRLAVAMQLTRLMATRMGYLDVSVRRSERPVRCRMPTT